MKQKRKKKSLPTDLCFTLGKIQRKTLISLNIVDNVHVRSPPRWFIAAH
ncbi:MAG: hypothetical protein JW776_04365 [Candidatus Lokiarchaeota archaeon]|nr:hypothetical protein [Candidatus Lokiarchaeota archaeon]